MEVEPTEAGGRPFRARPHGSPVAGAGLLLVRPTGVRLVDSQDGDCHMTGTVADVAFRGRGYDHAIDVPGRARLTGVFSQARAKRGDRVGLRFDPDGCHVFAPQEPQEPGPPSSPGPTAGARADADETATAGSGLH